MTVDESFENTLGGSTKLSPSGFFNYVFNFDSDNKAVLLNMFQYIIIALIPVIVLLKLIKEYIPEDDDKKESIELILEIVIQLGLLFVAMYLIDKIIRYFPTYSKVPYTKFNEISFIIPTLVLIMTMQTKLGAKINILYDRILEMWNGKTQVTGGNNQGNIRVSQPGIHQVSRADTLDNTIMAPRVNQLPQQNNISLIDSLPNMMNSGSGGGGGNNMQNQAMQNAFMDSMEPMAANGALGGAFGSSF
jgi:hypothetical protein